MKFRVSQALLTLRSASDAFSGDLLGRRPGKVSVVGVRPDFPASRRR